MNNMDSFTPTVISSRKAKKEIEHIKTHHADILQGINAQAERVRAINEQKKVDQAQQNQVTQQTHIEHAKIQSEQEKVRMGHEKQARTEQLAHEKEQMIHAQKMKELEIKHQVLSKE